MALGGCYPLSVGWRAGSLSYSLCACPHLSSHPWPSVPRLPLAGFPTSVHVPLVLTDSARCYASSIQQGGTQEVPDSRHGSPELFTLPTSLNTACWRANFCLWDYLCPEHFLVVPEPSVWVISGTTLLAYWLHYQPWKLCSASRLS